MRPISCSWLAGMRSSAARKRGLVAAGGADGVHMGLAAGVWWWRREAVLVATDVGQRRGWLGHQGKVG